MRHGPHQKARRGRCRRTSSTFPLAQRKTMTTLLPNDCRWPIGDPQLPGFHFCGQRKQDGHPYCEFHVRRASQPGRTRPVTYRPRSAA
ncbi:MAG: GcrA family cell cycle regulator [Hyphomicrobium sp.]|nr:GcrA family cell cycle regulator [Hyphomicrobium sp.]